jgi:site-specific recombinase XerD
MQFQDEALASYTTQLWADGKAALTIAQRCRHVKALMEWITIEEIRDLTTGTIARFFAQPALRSLKPATVNTLKTSIRDFFAYLHQSGMIGEDPTRMIRRARCGPPPPRGLADEERSRLTTVLSQAPLRDRVLFELMLTAGLRVGSAVGLDLEDLDLARGIVHLRNTKGGNDQIAHLPRHTADLIASIATGRTTGPLFASSRGKRLTTRHVQRLFTRYATEANLSVSSTHALRHTFAMNLYERTGDVLLVQKALRHRSLESTMVYARADDRRLRVALGS